MAWMMDEYSFHARHNEFGMITGKPSGARRLEGPRRRDGARRHLLRARGGEGPGHRISRARPPRSRATGNAGSFAHKLGQEMLGLKIIAVSDSAAAS
jgi:glutamate dehydrogenase (NAD(P)+)